jgi:tetratricopeptide (TPR) repeat protein
MGDARTLSWRRDQGELGSTMPAAGIDQTYWRDVIGRGSATFFVGAGISAPAPASLPLAAGLVASLIDPVLKPLALPANLARSIAKTLVQLRPEVITDVLMEQLGIAAAGPLLNALHGLPNPWHIFLAAALGKGCSVITTNFDTLIEKACDASGTRYETVVGTAVEERPSASSILFKIHGSIGGDDARNALSSVALAVRQVGRGLSIRQTKLLRVLVENRPLIVLGYSGRDDFDILPALLNLQRTARGLWIVHESNAPIKHVAGGARRRSHARPAVECAEAWPGFLTVFAGDTGLMMDLLRPKPGFGRPRDIPPVAAFPEVEPWSPGSEASTIALMYALVEARAFDLGTRLFAHVTKLGASSHILVSHAVLLEKDGTDLRSAAIVARRARTASKNAPPDIRALVLDQSGVIARRRGLHGLAVRFYDQALNVATRSKCPEWLIMQIRSHRAVALEYKNRRAEALREHRCVAEYEKRTGDLRGYAKSLNNIGIVHMNQRQWKPAIAAFEASCALKHDLGDARGIAQSLHNLGKLHYLRGAFDAAEKAFLESLRIRLGRGRDQHGAAQSYVALAHVALEAGKRENAAIYTRRALEAHEKFGDQRGIAQARGLLRALEA